MDVVVYKKLLELEAQHRATFPPRFIRASQIYTIPQSGVYNIGLVGCGGPNVCDTYISGSRLFYGSGGGGYSESEYFLPAGTELEITIASNAVADRPGSSTIDSLAFPEPMVAEAGMPGAVFTTVFTELETGPDGGSGFGGNVINAKGGRGGTCARTSGTTIINMYCGGGAAGSPLGDGGDGGSIRRTSTVGGSWVAGGGAAGGVTPITQTSSASLNAGIGAGTGGPTGENYIGQNSSVSVNGIHYVVAEDGTDSRGFENGDLPFYWLTGGIDPHTGNGGCGAGSSGSINTQNLSGWPGAFGGRGGCSMVINNTTRLDMLIAGDFDGYIGGGTSGLINVGMSGTRNPYGGISLATIQRVR